MSEHTTPRLPRIDEHEILISAPSEVVWQALVSRLNGFGATPIASYAHLVGANPPRATGDFPQLTATLPGFSVTDVSPQHHLVLTGEHRFSRYSLTFTLTPRTDGIALSAHTHAQFPGLRGQAYRALVIGSRGHQILVRRLLRGVRRQAERVATVRAAEARTSRYDALVSPEPALDVTAVQVNLFCADVAKAAQFYAALGFPAVFTAPAEGAAEHIEIDVAGMRIGLTSADAANRIASLGVTAHAAAGTELVFWCSDADRMFQAAVEAGATEVAPPRDSPDGRIRYGWVQDPEAHQLKFVAPL